MDNRNTIRESEADHVNRRDFLQKASVSAIGISCIGIADFYASSVSIIMYSDDSMASWPPVLWAAKELEESLTARKITVNRFKKLSQAPAKDLCIVVTSSNFSQAKLLLEKQGIKIPAANEALGLVSLRSEGKQVLLTCGHDDRGMVYAVLELVDRIQNSEQPLVSLNISRPIVEKPANVIRSITRLFVSDIEDKPWYNDREMWPKYLTMLATQRFNRFNLSFGIGYDFLRNVEDAYFLFAYPFLLSVPGYDVRAKNLPDAERDRNLEMLKFISEQTVARGLQFQLGLWMHGYQWINSPNPNYTIEGLTAETHGPYCRDAVRALLKACPAISGVTFRIHGESGVNEGSYEFWKMVFEGVATCGRKVEIDMHAKGMDQKMVDSALATGLPIIISPKYWAEHLGMPYHQADIRALEIPKVNKKTSVLMNLSEGSRSFIRYGYGDLLKQNRKYGVLHRIWPGTQRVLLGGDPVTGAAHARSFSFCGSLGAELMEPLSFKGRRGSGIAGSRIGYSDLSLNPKWDWEKYVYNLRIFGRLLYNPDTDPEVWRRYLRSHFAGGAGSVELALANATRILPIVLTAHGTSAGNNTYWPEMYTNQPIVISNEKNDKHLYDTPSPKVFGNVSPMDPQLFLSINDFTRELIKGEQSGKYNPVETAQWLEDYANDATKHLAKADTQVKNKKTPEFRRMAIDVSMQAGLGHFFASKFRSGVLYAIFEQTGDRIALEESLKAYRKARESWADVANLAKGVYASDITIGEQKFLRGHWLDRLPDLDEDISAMDKKLEQAKTDTAARQDNVRVAVEKALGRPRRTISTCKHMQPQQFIAGRPLEIAISVEKIPGSVQLFYRHVDQAERYEVTEMKLEGNQFRATIPATYVTGAYPLQYYFELRESPSSAWLYPGFNADLANQPYFVVNRA